MFSALEYLHLSNIVHRDINTSNIMVDSMSESMINIKLIYFGSAQALRKENDKVYPIDGSTHFMAPEMFISDSVCDPRVDVWSATVIIYILITLELPFCYQLDQNII